MEKLSLWRATANKENNRSPLVGDVTCDVVIIGAGYTGLSVAYHLQKQNTEAIILEKHQVGHGGSGRNGGEVLTGYLGSMESWAKKKGMEAAREMWQLSLDSIDLVESLVKEHNIDCDFTRNGSFFAAYKPQHLDGLKRAQEFLEKHFDYHDMEIVEKEHIHDELHTNFYHGGRVDKKAAHFHPLNFALGMAEAVEELGGKIYGNSPALRVERSQGRVVVKTKNGSVTAKEIVIATNAYSDDLHPVIKKTIVPVESIMIATEPLGEAAVEDWIKNNRAVHDTKNLLYYFRRTSDHRLAFGGSGRAFGKKGKENRFKELHQGMLSVFPQLKDAKIEYEWGGRVGFTKEMHPYIGQLADGTYFSFGYGGHGASISSMLGKLIADSILSGEEMDNPLVMKQLKTIPFHSQHAKAVGVLKFYKQFLDRIS